MFPLLGRSSQVPEIQRDKEAWAPEFWAVVTALGLGRCVSELQPQSFCLTKLPQTQGHIPHAFLSCCHIAGWLEFSSSGLYIAGCGSGTLLVQVCSTFLSSFLGSLGCALMAVTEALEHKSSCRSTFKTMLISFILLAKASHTTKPHIKGQGNMHCLY